MRVCWAVRLILGLTSGRDGSGTGAAGHARRNLKGTKRLLVWNGFCGAGVARGRGGRWAAREIGWLRKPNYLAATTSLDPNNLSFPAIILRSISTNVRACTDCEATPFI
ncbi:hypothetical protein BDY21DRAFT_342070 [Lineolata rhizophorae]|uniref:Secreted protein n=1 Tax=Lineolata rhizophorae TaxID=578093 RepID=A0A6A6P2T9_9PEZI|nr:hypothetical protein BDY21DRAFT_342070 [Lineolata rhizophorae]